MATSSSFFLNKSILFKNFPNFPIFHTMKSFEKGRNAIEISMGEFLEIALVFERNNNLHEDVYAVTEVHDGLKTHIVH